MKLIKTGIPGLDEILKGGVRENSAILVTGGPGTGKSILALQFILEGAKKGEPGLFISAEESIDALKEDVKSLGFNIEKYEKEKKIVLVKQPILSRKLVSIATPLNLIKEYKIKRVALDSLTLFEYMHLAGEMDYRKEVLDFIQRMKDAGVTLLATSEKTVSDTDVISYESEDFLFDGLILLIEVRKAESFERCIHIVKMRGQDHMLNIYPFKIEKGGIKIFPDQLPFSLIEEETRRKRE